MMLESLPIFLACLVLLPMVAAPAIFVASQACPEKTIQNWEHQTVRKRYPQIYTGLWKSSKNTYISKNF